MNKTKIINNLLNKKSKKKAQEEMVGFALIIIIVSVIILILFVFALRGNGDDNIVESNQAKSFIQSTLHYTTNCANGYIPNYYSIRSLITACKNNVICADNKDACEVLEEDLTSILDNSWPVGEDRPIKGYKFEILEEVSENQYEEILIIEKGNLNKTTQIGARETLTNDISIFFTVYM